MRILKKLKERLFGKKIVEKEPVLREWVNCRCSSEPCATVEPVEETVEESKLVEIGTHYELVEKEGGDMIIEVTRFEDDTQSRRIVYADNDKENNLYSVVNLLNMKESMLYLQTSISRTHEGVNEVLLKRLKEKEKEEE